MGDPGQGQAEQERGEQESLAGGEAGGIPRSAERPLSELRGAAEADGKARRSFTSDLSVNGFALCHQLGLEPLSQVMGSSIYQIGYQGAWGTTGYGGGGGGILIELDTLTQALNEVRGRALGRLGEEGRHGGGGGG